jgi:1,4-alpha-glucan branching enzyme
MKMAPKKITGTAKTKAKVLTKKVSFEILASEAREVYLAGDFNNWDASANLMRKDKKGLWKTLLSLKPGRYEYRFLVDGNWENDPSCSNCVPNEFGSQNCVRIVE